MGFCECGPNELEVGQKCRECEYVIPGEKEVRKNFWGCFAGSAILSGGIFYLVARFIDHFSQTSFAKLFSETSLWGTFEWKLIALVICVGLFLHCFSIMGPYYDGEAKWEEPMSDDGPGPFDNP